MKTSATSMAIAVLAFCIGCSDEDTSVTPEMHTDFSHDHKHQHAGHDGHEHTHKDGFKGTHSHGHSHSHRHGEPLHGGRIVSIGHTHHKSGATHFHAEVMPLVDGVIRFHLLTESDDGKSKDYGITAKEIDALISISDKESGGHEVSFVAAGEGEKASEFTLTIPDGLSEGESFSVVIPKLTLGGHRQNFSFSVSRQKAKDTEETEKPDENTDPAEPETSDE